MSRVPWNFSGYAWPVNPEEDSGWVPELVLSNRVAIGASRSRIQVGGIKSDVRQISGWIFGPSSSTHYTNMYNWMRSRTRAVLVDHLGVSRQAMLIEFKPQTVNASQEWRNGRQAYKYTATFLALD